VVGPSGMLMPPSSSELISAVGHPLRRQILSAYLEGVVDCASAAQLAGVLDQRAGQVAYHLKTLAKNGILRPVQTGQSWEGQGDCSWALGVEGEWLRVVLAVWAESDLSK
jgi:DNA-binding transcriptional ArsR family regulator